jgi:hypothetical protein
MAGSERGEVDEEDRHDDWGDITDREQGRLPVVEKKTVGRERGGKAHKSRKRTQGILDRNGSTDENGDAERRGGEDQIAKDRVGDVRYAEAVLSELDC